jgi:low temperature requirement protein LtrA
MPSVRRRSPGWSSGGTALFIAGHAAFKAALWRRVSWPRVAAVVLLGLLGLLAPHVSALALNACATVVVLAVAAADQFSRTGSGAADR